MQISRISGKVVCALAAWLIGTVLLLTWIARTQFHRALLEANWEHLETSAALVEPWTAGAADQERQRDELESLQVRFRVRITLVDAAGKILADSQGQAVHMESHAHRPEFVQARATGHGRSLRSSATLGQEMMYYVRRAAPEAAPVAFIRTALPTEPMKNQVAQATWQLAAAGSLAMLLIVAGGYAFSRRTAQRLAEITRAADDVALGKPAAPISFHAADELGGLADAVRRAGRQVAERELALRASIERLETVLGGMHEGVMAVDTSERVLLANDAARRLLGLDSKGLEGRRFREVTRIPALHDAVKDALAGRGPAEAEFETTGPRRLVLTLRAVRLPGAPCPGVVIVLHDVSDLRRLENLRREFVANVSHELKTPLSAIKAYAETLRMGAVDEPPHNRQFVERIEEQAERLHQLILDMLSLARVESGEKSFQIRDLPLAPLIDECVTEHRKAAADKQVAVSTEPPGEAVVIHADEEGVHTILNNLIDNAVKYTPSGGSVVVRWRREGEQAIVEVEDSGIGIAPADRDRVFERFYRSEKARSREKGGTGLGLAIVKHLVQAMRGSIELKSNLGEGSCFRVKLPQ